MNTRIVHIYSDICLYYMEHILTWTSVNIDHGLSVAAIDPLVEEMGTCTSIALCADAATAMMKLLLLLLSAQAWLPIS